MTAGRAAPPDRAPPGAQRALHGAEVESERLAALIRVAILAAVLAAVIVAQSAGFDHEPLVVATAVYGVITVVGLVLAFRRIFRPWLPYAMIGLDMATLAAAILVLGRMLGLATDVAVTLPVGGLVIVVLLHASMRYRPELVVFAVAVFVAAVAAGSAWPGLAPGTGTAGHGSDHLAHFRLFPLAIFGLAALILVLTTRRTRRFINDAYTYASRAATLSRYFSPEVVEELTTRPDAEASFGDRMHVAVVFADVRGFTAMAEAMDPAELANFLSEFRSRIAAPALANGGVVDKYIGDAIMVVYGAPKARGADAQRALRSAMAMLASMNAWSDDRRREGMPPVHVGIGAHWGNAFAGVLSDGRLLEYTVIGDTVNVASRLVDLAPSGRTALVVSADLAQAAGGLPDPGRWERVEEQSLPGHPRAITVFRLG